jgi:hypothetical protein
VIWNTGNTKGAPWRRGSVRRAWLHPPAVKLNAHLPPDRWQLHLVMIGGYLY